VKEEEEEEEERKKKHHRAELKNARPPGIIFSPSTNQY
jgi:hypothetical protein